MLLPFRLFGDGSGAPVVPATPASDPLRMLKSLYDPTRNALRLVDAGAASGQAGTEMDWRQVIAACYDRDNNKLRIVQV